MLAREADITVLDFETTAPMDDAPAEPWQLGLVMLRQGSVDMDSAFESYLNVRRPLQSPLRLPISQAEAEAVEHAPSLITLWPRLQSLLAGTLAAHNIGTERTILKRLAPLHRFGPWLDTLALVRKAYPDLKSHALADVIAALSLEDSVRRLCPNRQAHDALFDAAACACLLAHLLEQPAWSHVTIHALSSVSPKSLRPGRKQPA